MPNEIDERQFLFDSKHAVVSLIGDSGIHFLDYEIDVSKQHLFKDFKFYDNKERVTETKEKIVDRFLLHVVEDRDKELSPDERSDPEDRIYESIFNSSVGNIRAGDPGGPYTSALRNALHIFDRQWLPVSFFKGITTGGELESGPSNWARIYIASPNPAENQSLFRIVLAFDTELFNAEESTKYAGPVLDDCSSMVRFRLVDELESLCKYACGEWQQEWIKDAYLERKNNKSENRENPLIKNKEYKMRHYGEACAHYVTLISALQLLTKLPSIRLIRAAGMYPDDPSVSSRELQSHYVDVDLVLDIGNSRTCGLLVEFGTTDERTSLGAQPPTALKLREIERPYRMSDEPFESRVEFLPANFGKSLYGRRSGRSSRTDAFWWPSPVRVGREAGWLATHSSGREGASGMSSPKRFVWDRARRPQPWVNNRRARQANGRLPKISGPIASELSENGSLRPSTSAFSGVAAYSRGSMYMLMIAELVCHALVQINSPAYRYDRSDTDVPRRLRKIILTLPSATPLTEQNRMRIYVKQAIELVWRAYKWNNLLPLHIKPVLKFDWDEATCTQLVYLYNELEFKFIESPDYFFKLYGSGKKGKHGGNSLRIGSIDIGGGTTDLMIIDHELYDRVILPKQLFRECIKLAGDDILKGLIESLVLPIIVSAAESSGLEHARDRISYLFSGDSKGINREDQVRRSAFVNQVFVPCAVRLLTEYEKTQHQTEDREIRFMLSEVIDQAAMDADVVSFLNDEIARQGARTLDWSSIEILIQPANISGIAHSVMATSLQDFCDVVRAYGCDMLLISGRPSGMLAIREIIKACAPVTPDRVIPMYGYRTANWYPFRSDDSRIWDPKTTTSVGAMLCHLLEGDYAHFVFEASEIKPKSTARFLGRMNQSGMIPEDEIFFVNTDDDDKSFQEFEAVFTSWLDVGYRQLPYERWTTSLLYRVQFLNEDIARSTPVPIKVKLKRSNDSFDDEDMEIIKEAFDFVEATDRNGNDISDHLVCKLQTFKTMKKIEAGYWIDSGVLDTSSIIGRI